MRSLRCGIHRHREGHAACASKPISLTFASMDAFQKATATPGFKKVADDLGNFATGGVTVLIGEETNQR